MQTELETTPMDLPTNPAPAVDASIARGAARLRAGGLDTMLAHAEGLGLGLTYRGIPRSQWPSVMLAGAQAIIKQERAKDALGHWAFRANRLMAAHELRVALED